jgi:hypothetical protein
MSEARYYGVSSGDGNNGVSHMFCDYVVKTDDPYRLVELAAVTTFKKGKGQAWALENMEVGGEAEYVLSAVFYESPEEQQEAREDAQAKYEAGETEDDPSNWDNGPAWLIIEVFPWDDDLPERCPVFDSLEDAYTTEDLELIKAHTA